jgi:hypothetical protein
MRLTVAVVALTCAAAAMYLASQRRAGERNAAGSHEWTDRFDVDRAELSSVGRNPYFVLEPGWTSVLEGDDGASLVITVLDETKLVDGVETRVVEERETENGELVEVSRNFFAISTRTGAVFYFGEEVDLYQNGVVSGHEGAWLAGEGDNRFGLAMPALPLLGARYYQEIAPGVAMDRAEIVGTSDTMTTPMRRFDHVLKIAETTPLEPGVREYKYYAGGAGLLRDESMRLVRYGYLVSARAPTPSGNN